ncbi:MAG: glycosyltransferase family 1 protein [Candidatus Sulfotelmatobacter sp.]
MRIGIDLLRADPEYVGGLNTYIMGLLDGFAAVGRKHHFQLYLTDANRSWFAHYEALPNFEAVALNCASFRLRQAVCRMALFSPNPDLYRRISGGLFQPIRRIMDARSDVIYSPTVSLLCFDHRKPTLLSMHDIQHLHYPQFFSWPRRLSRRVTCALSAAHASQFQASSEFIRRDMLSHFPNLSCDRISVIPEGVSLAHFSASGGDAALNRYRLEKRFLFLPAQLWPHKNHLTVLRALRRIERDRGLKIPLVMTGSRYSGAAAVFNFKAKHRMDYVRYLGAVPFPHLVALYRRAALAVSPGLYESNSLPVLEAAAAGTAVIASKIAPNEELAATLQLNLFPPLDEGALADLILDSWRDESMCRKQALHNREAVRRFSWENAARQYLSVMEEMLNPNLGRNLRRRPALAR